jgi:hypothetical protein
MPDRPIGTPLRGWRLLQQGLQFARGNVWQPGASASTNAFELIPICYNPVVMNTIEAVLVPAKTAVSAKGDGAAVDVSGSRNRVFLLTLSITKIIEQESLDLMIYGSADGAAWEPKPIAAFAQKFYCEETPLLLDLTAHPEVKFVRAHWEVARWGRGIETPMFEFGVTMREVPADILKEATAEAKAMA